MLETPPREPSRPVRGPSPPPAAPLPGRYLFETPASAESGAAAGEGSTESEVESDLQRAAETVQGAIQPPTEEAAEQPVESPAEESAEDSAPAPAEVPAEELFGEPDDAPQPSPFEEPADDSTPTPSFEDLFGDANPTRILAEPGGLQSPQTRLWRGLSSPHSCDARLDRVGPRRVGLVRPNGTRASVALQDLSTSDLQFLRRQISAKRELLAQQRQQDSETFLASQPR